MRALLFLAVLLLAACGKSKGSASDRPPDKCAVDADCPQGWKCLAKQCTDPSIGAVFTDPEHALTPQKVKDHVDQTNDQREENIDKAMKKADQE